VVAALQTWEPRIRNIRVEFDHRPEEGQLIANVSYEVRRSGVTDSQPIPLRTG